MFHLLLINAAKIRRIFEISKFFAKNFLILHQTIFIEDEKCMPVPYPILNNKKKGKARKTKVTMLDHTKTLKLVGKNGRQPRPNGLVVSAGK